MKMNTKLIGIHIDFLKTYKPEYKKDFNEKPNAKKYGIRINKRMYVVG